MACADRTGERIVDVHSDRQTSLGYFTHDQPDERVDRCWIRKINGLLFQQIGLLVRTSGISAAPIKDRSRRLGSDMQKYALPDPSAEERPARTRALPIWLRA